MAVEQIEETRTAHRGRSRQHSARRQDWRPTKFEPLLQIRIWAEA
jgi:hypothetical protein